MHFRSNGTFTVTAATDEKNLEPEIVTVTELLQKWQNYLHIMHQCEIWHTIVKVCCALLC